MVLWWYTDILGCSINRFSKGEVSIITGPDEVKHGGGVTNHDSSIERQGREDRDSDRGVAFSQ